MVATPADVQANRPFLLAHPHLLEVHPDAVGSGADRLVAGLAELIGEAIGGGAIDHETSARPTYQMVVGLLVDRAAVAQPISHRVVSAAAPTPDGPSGRDPA